MRASSSIVLVVSSVSALPSARFCLLWPLIRWAEFTVACVPLTQIILSLRVLFASKYPIPRLLLVYTILISVESDQLFSQVFDVIWENILVSLQINNIYT